MRVARIAASTTACLARLNPKKSRRRPCGDGLDDDGRPVLAVVELDDAKLVVSARVGQDLASHHVRRPRGRDRSTAAPIAVWARSSTSSVTWSTPSPCAFRFR